MLMLMLMLMLITLLVGKIGEEVVEDKGVEGLDFVQGCEFDSDGYGSVPPLEEDEESLVFSGSHVCGECDVILVDI
jgi:hypothetical protein